MEKGHGRSGGLGAEPSWTEYLADGRVVMDNEVKWRCDECATGGSGGFEKTQLSDFEKKFLMWSKTSEEIVFFGIIDILTEYTRKKKAEHFCCGTLRCAADVSCQPASIYADRFYSFMQEAMDGNIDADTSTALDVRHQQQDDSEDVQTQQAQHEIQQRQTEQMNQMVASPRHVQTGSEEPLDHAEQPLENVQQVPNNDGGMIPNNDEMHISEMQISLHLEPSHEEGGHDQALSQGP
eukprot:SAG31_NODE_73_length_27793_cov_26.900520_22_plen_237_part_00